MGQVYLEEFEGPLYAFLEFTVGGVTVSTDPNVALEHESLDHVTEYDGNDTYISNVVMSFSITRTSSGCEAGRSWNVNNEFNISVFDESAVYVESIIADAMSSNINGASCAIRYGWSANGKIIPERTSTFSGMIRGYNISFEGPSTILTVEGVSTMDLSFATNYSGNIELPESVTSSGNPGEIMEYIFENYINVNGDYMLDLEATRTEYKDEETKKEIQPLPVNGNSLIYYMKEYLCGLAVSEETGASNYSMGEYIDENGQKWFYFKPKSSIASNYITYDENDRIVSVSNTVTDSEATRVYNYYGDLQTSEVMSFSIDFNFFAVNGGAKSTSAVDVNTNELIFVKVGDLSVDAYSPSEDSRIMGLSSSSHSGLDKSMRDLWNKYASQVYNADLEILGDPNLHPFHIIQVNIFTKYHQLHHTSGIYMVMSVEDSVDSSGFTSSVSLHKMSSLKDSELAVVIETDGYNNPTGKVYQSGTSSSLWQEEKASDKVIAYVNPENDRGFPSSVNTATKSLPQNTNTNMFNSNQFKYIGSDKNSPAKGNSDIIPVVFKGGKVDFKGESNVANPVTYKDIFK